jgi:hypothetical protein
MNDAARLDVLPQIDADVVWRAIVERSSKAQPIPDFRFLETYRSNVTTCHPA